MEQGLAIKANGASPQSLVLSTPQHQPAGARSHCSLHRARSPIIVLQQKFLHSQPRALAALSGADIGAFEHVQVCSRVFPSPFTSQRAKLPRSHNCAGLLRRHHLTTAAAACACRAPVSKVVVPPPPFWRDVGSRGDAVEALCGFTQVTGAHPAPDHPVTHLPLGLQHQTGERGEGGSGWERFEKRDVMTAGARKGVCEQGGIVQCVVVVL